MSLKLLQTKRALFPLCGSLAARGLAICGLVLCGLAACGGSNPEPPSSPSPAPVAASITAPSALVAPTASAPPALPPPNPTGLSLPVRLSGEDAVLPEALGSSGPLPTARARCTITTEGKVTECQVLEAPPSTNDIVLRALSTWRYRPALLKGSPVESQNTLTIAFTLPASRPMPAPATSSAPITVIPFGEGMTRPKLIAGANPDYTPEARAAGVEGVVIARCVITLEGRLRDCVIVKGIPQLDKPVLDSLGAQRYTPVIFNGKPAEVLYTLTFKFRLD